MSKAKLFNISAKEMAGGPHDSDSALVRGKSAMEMAGYVGNSDSIDIVVTRTKKMYPWTDRYTSGKEIELRIHKRDSAKIVDYYENKVFKK